MGQGEGGDRFDEWAGSYEDFYPAGTRFDLEFRLSRKLVLASRRWTGLIDEAIRVRTGHSRARWQTLFAICFSGNRGVTTIELSERMGVQWPTLVRTLNDLEEHGMIARVENPRDRRSRLISITPEGRKVVEDVQPILDPVRHAVLQDMDEQEITDAERLLDKILIGVAGVAAKDLRLEIGGPAREPQPLSPKDFQAK